MDGPDEEIEIAVSIDVPESRTATPMTKIDTRLHGYVDKRPVALILLETIGLGISSHDVKINLPVTVVVSRGDASTCAIGFR